MVTTDYLIPIYIIYAIVSIGLTIWLARTLFKSGEVFLLDVFEDKPGLAHAVNVLLVIGFYMLNFGYAALILRADPPSNSVGAIETLARKLGVLIFTLGLIHFVNMMVFFAIRKRVEMRNHPPPVPPQQYYPPQPPRPTPGTA